MIPESDFWRVAIASFVACVVLPLGINYFIFRDHIHAVWSERQAKRAR